MLERILGFSLSRFAAATVLLSAALVACNPTETSRHGYVEIVPSGLRESVCATPISGHLQLDGLLVAGAVTVASDELCHDWIVRKELPAGLYTVSWQDAAADDAGEARWKVRDASTLNVFPERTTRVRVLRVEPDAELASQALVQLTDR